MADMQWFRQTPFQAVLVFGIGIGLGLAWKSGAIPVEFGSANTGSLADDAGADPIASIFPGTDVNSPGTISPELPAEDPDLFATQPAARAVNADLPVLSARPALTPSATRPDLAELVGPGNPVRSVVQAAQVVPAIHANNEPEWAAEPTANQADQIQAASIPRRYQKTPSNFREGEQVPATVIRQTSGEEPVANVADKSATQPPRASSILVDELAAIDEQIANEEFLKAHRALSKLYWNHADSKSELLPRLEKTSRAIFFEPRPHFVEPYVVQPNDQLRIIAGKHQLSWEYLAKLNRTDPRRIQLGQKLKILKGPFSAVVDLSDFALTVHLQGYFVRRYEVGIGKDGASPVGKFTVLNKVENPQYTGPDGKVVSADDPANPLGERWIDLGESYGIHGTIEPDSIGKAASRGCIRMREKDVIEVYDFLVKGSEVVIRK
jgi:LysM repeat protein